MSRVCLILFLFFFLSTNLTFASGIRNSLPELSIYEVDLSQLEDYKKIEKDSTLGFVLLNDVSTKKNEKEEIVNFKIFNNETINGEASGFLSTITPPARFSMTCSLQLTANKFYLEDGQEINFSANSPSFTAVHPPHADSGALTLARTITNLAIGTSPATFGISLGVSFLVNGLLSAKQNGIGDFFWGGLDGTGLSFLENLFRKQPHLFLEEGTFIPFTLKEDLKISKGIQKEKTEHLNIAEEEALTKIKNLLEWGDLSGAIEYAFKTRQHEIYNKLLEIISIKRSTN